MNTFPSRALAALAFSSLAATAALAGVTRDYSDSIDMSGITKVVVEISSGHIELRGVDGDTLALEVEQDFGTSSDREADEMAKRIERVVEKRDGALHVKFRYERGAGSGFIDSLFGGNPNVAFHTEIDAPKGVEVTLKTSGGHIEVHGMAGSVDAHTSGGHLEFADLSGPLKGRTSGGHIEARNIQADIELDTSGGNVELSDITGNVSARTSGGKIEARNIEGALDAHTSGGSVFASFDRGLTGDSSLSTSGGSIKARLPSGQRFDIAAETSGGGVNLRHSGSNTGSFKKNKIDAHINGGGPLLKLRSSGGSIDISDS